MAEIEQRHREKALEILDLGSMVTVPWRSEMVDGIAQALAEAEVEGERRFIEKLRRLAAERIRNFPEAGWLMCSFCGNPICKLENIEKVRCSELGIPTLEGAL